MQLCYSCRHAFPPSSLGQCSFSDIISHRLDEIHNIVNEMKVETAEGTHQVLQLRGALRELCSAIHQEFGALKQDKGGQEAAKRRNLQEQGELVTSFPNIKQENHIHSPATQMTTPTIPRHSYGGCSPRATFNGTVPSHKIRKMNSALELVSASIYCVLESVAIRTRAAVALLWIPPPGAVSAELVAPFVVGRDVSRLRNSAPYRVGETSIPCAVSEAGIALNLKPRPGAFDPRASENSPLVDLIETSNAAQLLVPVFTRYGEVQRSVLGVLHLLGTPVIPCPFTQRNEEMAVQTAATLSIIVSSHYEVMGGEWANRIYDPSLLISASAYQGTLDMRSTQKVVDDFAPPPILIYRGVNERKPEDDIREEVKALRNLMTRRPERRAEIYSVKDLQHYATTMEQNWVALLGTITEMENKINKLEENALRTDLPKKQQCMSSSLEQTSNTQSESNGLHSSRCASPSTGALPSLYDARSVIKPEQLNSIEIAAAQKLRALKGDPSIFITEKEV
ncbi:uncharacterized protein TEOVI_000841900 [Trypanosoma equiperdum]|uniref:Uncharacterized protein n=3 Tax=Trypanozoon TaxID=39700 RepID=Q38AI1_TRYB2|nr:hypothetical protein, conserved [Trypanosoma brucei brucei TREU927]EAN78189.1 hypothetical protein, conserved [Trypanosoma brucei brucei TREU927]SCU64630.1 hypothetical protein, conserved [Trypanosoma equiperdum]